MLVQAREHFEQALEEGGGWLVPEIVEDELLGVQPPEVAPAAGRMLARDLIVGVGGIHLELPRGPVPARAPRLSRRVHEDREGKRPARRLRFDEDLSVRRRLALRLVPGLRARLADCGLRTRGAARATLAHANREGASPRTGSRLDDRPAVGLDDERAHAGR